MDSREKKQWTPGSVLLPQIFCASKLEDQTPKENECILEKNGNPGIHNWLCRHYEASKQNPHGGNERAKRKHETDEEPNSSACLSHAALAVAVTSHLAIRNCVYHEEGHRGDDSAGVVGVMELPLVRVFHRRVDDDPPAGEEQHSGRDGRDGVPPLAPVHVALAVAASDAVQEPRHDSFRFFLAVKREPLVCYQRL